MNLLDGEVAETGAETVVKLASGGVARSAVPTTDADRGMQVRVGIRPEDFVPTDGAAVYAGEVDITEALGEVTQLYFRPEDGASPVIAKLPGIHSDLRHTSVALAADPRKVHLFHNGKSLLYRWSAGPDHRHREGEAGRRDHERRRQSRGEQQGAAEGDARRRRMDAIDGPIFCKANRVHGPILACC